MSELEQIERKKFYVKVNGEKREVRFNFSAWAKIEKKYGSVTNFKNIEKDLKDKPFETLPFLIYAGLVNKEGVTEENCLDDYDLTTIDELKDVLQYAMTGSLPDAKEKDEKN